MSRYYYHPVTGEKKIIHSFWECDFLNTCCDEDEPEKRDCDLKEYQFKLKDINCHGFVDCPLKDAEDEVTK